MDTHISKRVNDIIQKYASSLFRNVTLEFYGIKIAPIKELINPELPIVTVGGSSTDLVFLLMDDSYLHFAFETGYRKEGLIKNAGYDLRLYERDRRLVHTVVIYTANVGKRSEGLNIGSLTYNPDIILMGEYDGNIVFTKLEKKIKSNLELTDVDILNLVLLPLMKHTIPRHELAENTIKLANTIPDPTKRNACIAAAFAFASKYLDENDKTKLKEVIKMFEIANMLMEDKAIEIAKNLLKLGVSIDTIVESTGLSETKVKELQDELTLTPV